MDANGILSRGRKLAEKLSAKDRLEIVPGFKVEVALKVLAKKGYSDDRTLDEIAVDFGRKVCKALGITPEEPAPQPVKVATDAVARNVVVYGEDGEVNDVGKNTLINLGFKVGMPIFKARTNANNGASRASALMALLS